ncbi:unnamed protein product [Colias eurytheme]|nr:unnamed protein product [Colias eurytheme]
MPGMDLAVATRLSPSPRDMSPALAIAIPMMKSVNLVPAQCFDNMAYHSERSEDKSKDDSSRQESIEETDKNEYSDKNDDKSDVRTPLLRDHKIESLDETKLRDTKVEKRKSSAST